MPKKMEWFEETFKTSKKIDFHDGSHFWICFGTYNRIDYEFRNITEFYARRDAEQFFRKRGILR